MNQRYRNEAHGGYHGDKMSDRDDRYTYGANGSRDWDQRDLGTRGGAYANYDRGLGQGAGGREFREFEYGGDTSAGYAGPRTYGESGGGYGRDAGMRYGSRQYGGEEYGWGTQSYGRGEYSGSPGGDNRFASEGYGGPGGYRPEGSENQRNFAGGGRDDRQAGQYGGQMSGRQARGGYGYGDEYGGMGREVGAGQYGGQFRSGQYESGGSLGSGYGSQYGAYGSPGMGGRDMGTGRGGQGGQYGGQGFGMGQGADAGMYGSPRTGQYGQYGQDPGRTQAGRGARGLGPKGYRRSDERLQEDICERLTDDWQIDASDISVRVADGVVTLEGSVPERRVKHRVEDLIESCGGVSEIRNQLTVSRSSSSGYGSGESSSTRSQASSRSGGTQAGTSTTTTTGTSGRSGSGTEGKH